MKARTIIRGMQSLVGFSVIAKCMTSKNPEKLFHVKFWFAWRREIFDASTQCCSDRLANIREAWPVTSRRPVQHCASVSSETNTLYISVSLWEMAGNYAVTTYLHSLLPFYGQIS